MEAKERQLQEYVTRTGKDPFDEWLKGITDKTTRARIRTRLSRLRLGNFGDCHGVEEGVNEIRLWSGLSCGLRPCRRDARPVTRRC
jgi:putative addiction module killer protein